VVATSRTRISNSGGRSSRYIAAYGSAAVPDLPTTSLIIAANTFIAPKRRIAHDNKVLYQGARKKKKIPKSDRLFDMTFSFAEQESIAVNLNLTVWVCGGKYLGAKDINI
jgi:hypothetical protein